MENMETKDIKNEKKEAEQKLRNYRTTFLYGFDSENRAIHAEKLYRDEMSQVGIKNAIENLYAYPGVAEVVMIDNHEYLCELFHKAKTRDAYVDWKEFHDYCLERGMLMDRY